MKSSVTIAIELDFMEPPGRRFFWTDGENRDGERVVDGVLREELLPDVERFAEHDIR